MNSNCENDQHNGAVAMIQDRLDPGTVAAMLQMVANCAPALMRTGRFEHDTNDRAEITRIGPDERAEVIRRFRAQRAAGQVNLHAIARDMGRSYAIIQRIVRPHRQTAVGASQ
jgi:hypothetical protein